MFLRVHQHLLDAKSCVRPAHAHSHSYKLLHLCVAFILHMKKEYERFPRYHSWSKSHLRLQI
jgi:hypothetical protein